jgi:hypothetical protein
MIVWNGVRVGHAKGAERLLLAAKSMKRHLKRDTTLRTFFFWKALSLIDFNSNYIKVHRKI